MGCGVVAYAGDISLRTTSKHPQTLNDQLQNDPHVVENPVMILFTGTYKPPLLKGMDITLSNEIK